MSDDTHDDTSSLADPFCYEDSVSQRAMAFYHVQNSQTRSKTRRSRNCV